MSTLCAHFPWHMVLPFIMSADLTVLAAISTAAMTLLTTTCRPLPGAECVVVGLLLEIIDPQPGAAQRSAAQYCSIFAHAEALVAAGKTDLYRELPIALGLVRRSNSGLLGHPCLAVWECANAPAASVGRALLECGELRPAAVACAAAPDQLLPEGQGNLDLALVPAIDGPTRRLKVRLACPPSGSSLTDPKSPRILPFSWRIAKLDEGTAAPRRPLQIEDHHCPPQPQDGQVWLLHAPCVALSALRCMQRTCDCPAVNAAAIYVCIH